MTVGNVRMVRSHDRMSPKTFPHIECIHSCERSTGLNYLSSCEQANLCGYQFVISDLAKSIATNSALYSHQNLVNLYLDSHKTGFCYEGREGGGGLLFKATFALP